MKLLHLSDLHLGKRVFGFSMLEDQKFILHQILDMAVSHQVDGVMIAGDIYDRSTPPAEAVALLDDFLTKLASRKIQVLAISGNHDSPERISFGRRLMERSGIHLSRVYEGRIDSVDLEDEHGKVHFYLLPFVRPSDVRPFEEVEIKSFQDAVEAAVRAMAVDTSQRNVILAHQFVTGASRSDSEDIWVGGLDNVSGDIFRDFDYAALGHIHNPQKIGRETLRYAGTPLAYSFSEIGRNKSVPLITLREKGDVEIQLLDLNPLREMREVRGSFQELYYPNEELKKLADAYLHITLTDEMDVPDAAGKLRQQYPYFMRLDYDNTRTRTENQIKVLENQEFLGPEELFQQFYEMQNGRAIGEMEEDMLGDLLKEIFGEEA